MNINKVLIISYYYHPSNFAGSERVYAWTKYLHNFGYYPIVLTRNWNENQIDLVSDIKDNSYKKISTETCETIYMPYKRSLRDRLSSFPRLRLLQKALTFFELLFNPISIRVLPYANLYFEAEEILEKDKSISAVIISGNPYQLFHFGYLLKKKFNIKWIPDYRDEWSTHPNLPKISRLEKLLLKRDRILERKWTENADAFISVSESCVDSIQRFIQKPGFVVRNGFDFALKPERKKVPNENTFIITYSGTLYPSQQIEVFISALKCVIKENKSPFKIKVNFMGISPRDSEYKKLKNLTSGYDDVFFISERVSKQEIETILANSDLLFATAYDGVNDWTPVKFFEYYTSNTPILLCPSDKGKMEEFIAQTNCGYYANNREECSALLITLLEKKKNGDALLPLVNPTYAMQFTRAEQTKRLALVLDNLLVPIAKEKKA